MTKAKKETVKKVYTRKLYHLTFPDVVEPILSDGFLGGEGGLVWFAEHPNDADGVPGRSALIEVRATIRDVRKYVIYPEYEPDILNDPVTGQKITWQFKCRWYALPPEVANQFPRRLVPDDEYYRMTI